MDPFSTQYQNEIIIRKNLFQLTGLAGNRSEPVSFAGEISEMI